MAKHFELEEEKAIVLIEEGKKGQEKYVQELKKDYETALKRAVQRNNKHLNISQFPIVGAFVIFESEKARNTALHAMNNYGLFKFNGDYPSQFLFNGKDRLKIQAAPEPYSVFWENYNVSSFGRIFRGIIIAIPLILLLGVSYYSAYFIR